MSKATLIHGLNEDLAAEWESVVRYIYQANQVVEAAGLESHITLMEDVEEKLHHITFLTNEIISLGGKPMTQIRPIEEERDLKAMLELDLDLELREIENYHKHAQLAERLGDVKLKAKLEALAVDEVDHARELCHLIQEL